MQLAINNLDDVVRDWENDKKADPQKKEKQFVLYIKDKKNVSVRTPIEIPLKDVVALVKKNFEQNKILSVPGLKTRARLVEGTGDRTGTDTGKARSPTAFTCIRGTLLKNPQGQWEGCPEGTILLDSELVNQANPLTTPYEYIRKAKLSSMLVHEKTHEFLLNRAMAEATRLGMTDETDSYWNARADVISDSAHKTVYELQAAVLSYEYDYLRKIEWKKRSNKNQSADKENAIREMEGVFKELIDRSTSTEAANSRSYDKRVDSDICPPPRTTNNRERPPYRPAPPYQAAPPQITYSTGIYLGGELVKNWGWVRSTERLAATDFVTNEFSDRADPVGGGFLVGYKFAPYANSVIVSPFASFDFMNAPVNHTFFGGSYLGTTANFMGTLGLKVGPQLGEGIWLYGIAGVSTMNETLNINFIPVSSSQSTWVAGGTAGFGGAFQPGFLQGLGQPVSLFAEYQHTWWQSANFNTPAASPAFNYNFARQDDMVKLGFIVSLGSMSAPPAAGYPVKAPPLK